jgi:hypothetical protein
MVMQTKSSSSFLVGIMTVALLLSFPVRSASAQSFSANSDAVGHESTNNSKPPVAKRILEIPIALEVDLRRSLRALETINPPHLEIRTAYFMPESMAYSYLTKATYLSIFVDPARKGSFSPYDARGTERFTLATAANILGLRMARSERWSKVWWLPQASCIVFNVGVMKESESNDSSASDKRFGAPSRSDKTRRH